MILRPQLDPTDHQSVLDYYLENYSEVHIITCSKCGADLGIEIRGEVFNNNGGYKVNDAGYTVLPFGDALMSSRVRTDEHTPGIRMMGYQCGAWVPNPEYALEMKAYWKAMDKYEKMLKKGEVITPPEPITIPELIRCGNDTRGSAIEEAISPTGSFLPHEVAKIQEAYRQSRYKPDFKRVGNKEHHETFIRERIK